MKNTRKNSGIIEQIMMNRFHPKYMNKWKYDWGFDDIPGNDDFI